MNRGRGVRPVGRPPTPPPSLPPAVDAPFENEFDDRKRRDISRKKKKPERETEKAAPKMPRNPNRRSSGRSWRDLDYDDEEEY